MANIFTSSIGKKLIMSITGIFLVLFLTFHLVMNAALVFSDSVYDSIVAFLGANWYALVGTIILTAGILIHFIYAIILTLQNRKARGKIRYEVRKKEPGVDWASKNMFILGIIVVCGLLVHLWNFWYNMQWTEIIGLEENVFTLSPLEGAALVRLHFSNIWYVLIYVVWFVALWFHLTHGVWSMLHSLGWNSKVWMKRLRWISYIVATLLMGGFLLIVVIIHLQSIGVF